MTPSRKGKQRADHPAPTTAVLWDPYAQPEPEDDEVWDPEIVWELERIVGLEIASDGTKQYVPQLTLEGLPSSAYAIWS